MNKTTIKLKSSYSGLAHDIDIVGTIINGKKAIDFKSYIILSYIVCGGCNPDPYLYFRDYDEAFHILDKEFELYTQCESSRSDEKVSEEYKQLFKLFNNRTWNNW